MNTSQKKFSLYLQINGNIDFSITPHSDHYSVENDCKVYHYVVDVNKSNTFKLQVTKLDDNDCYIKIDKILLNNIEIPDIQRTAYFVACNGAKEKNNGYINKLGTFVFRTHGNVVSHNFINYFLSLTEQ